MARFDDFRDLVQAIIDFANEREGILEKGGKEKKWSPTKRHRLFGKMLTDSYRLGLIPGINLKEYGIEVNALPHISFPDTFNPENDLASEFQADLIDGLFHLKNAPAEQFGATLFTEWWGKEKNANGKPRLCLSFQSRHTYNQLSTLLEILLFILGYQAVKHCPGCNAYFVQKRKGKIDKLTCSNKCRQRTFSKGLKEEEEEIAKTLAAAAGANNGTETQNKED